MADFERLHPTEAELDPSRNSSLAASPQIEDGGRRHYHPRAGRYAPFVPPEEIERIRGEAAQI
jgi:hypothetical protein